MHRLAATKPLLAVDLFAGAGGLTLGFEQAGIKVVVAVENDKWAAEAHRLNFPHCAVLEKDIQVVTGQEILETAHLQPGEIDVIIGGPPCQGFSYAGRRDRDDPRNALTEEYVRLVRELRPKAFVMENVPGLKTMENGAVLRSICLELARDYSVTFPVQVLTASQFGVPQKRQRLFILGCRLDLGRSILYPTRTHLVPGEPGYVYDHDRQWSGSPGSSGNGFRFCPTAFDALHDLPDVDLFPHLIDGDTTPYPNAEPLTPYAVMMRTGQVGDDDLSVPRPSWNPNELTNCKRTMHDARIVAEFAALCHGGNHASRRKKLTPWGISTTIRAGTKADKGSRTALRPIHYASPRVITVREAARLMSFPDWVTFHDTKWHGFRLVGAAVPPLLARAIGRQVRATIATP